MAHSSIKKGEVYGDFTPIGRKDTRSGYKFRCVCRRCDSIKTFAESTLRRKPRCARCKHAARRSPAGKKAESNLATFRKDREGLMEMIESIPDGPETAFEKEAIAALVSLIPDSELAYRESPTQGHAYALNSLLSGIRELRQDLEDRDAQGEIVTRLLENAVRPKFHDIVRAIIDSHYGLKKQLAPYVDKKRRSRMSRDIDEASKELGAKLEMMYSEIEAAATGTQEQPKGGRRRGGAR